jgi:uncharacterized protein (UPF0332 family)
MTEENRKQIVDFRILNARNTLQEVLILAQNELWNTAINRLYYACYYAASALLIASHIETHTHAGVRQMLALHFIKSGIMSKHFFNTFGLLYEKRQTGDYEDFVCMTKEDIDDLYPLAVEFVDEIVKLLTSRLL